MDDIKDGTIPQHTELEEVPTRQVPREVDENDLKAMDTTVLESEYRTSKKTWLVLFIMGLAWGTCTLANVGPSSTYTYAIKELGGTTVESWIPNAALFPLIGLQPIWGSIGDRFGKKYFIVAGGLFGLVGSVVSGTATSAEIIIVGQALSGVGSSLFLLVIPAGMEIVPARSRSFAQGGMGLINGILAIIGLLEAGAFSKMSPSGWRWVYYFNAIFFGVCATLIFLSYNPPPTKLRREMPSAGATIASVDFIGIALLLFGVICFVTSVTWGGNAYAWNSTHVLALLIVSVVTFVGFGVYETFGRNDGLLDHRFFNSRNFLLVLSVAFVDGMLLYGVNAFLPVESQAIFTSDPVKVNVYLLPLNILVLVGILTSAYVLGATKHYRSILIGSLGIIALFLGLLVLVNPSRVAMMLVFTGLIGLGVGVTTVIPVVILTYAVPSHLIGTAGTLLASTRALGGTVGITIFASIYANKMKANLPTGVAAAAIKAGLPASSVKAFVVALLGEDTAALTTISGVTPKIIGAAVSAIKVISAQSFRMVWIANMAVAIAALIVCLFLQPVREQMTPHVELALEDSQLRRKQLNTKGIAIGKEDDETV